MNRLLMTTIAVLSLSTRWTHGVTVDEAVAAALDHNPGLLASVHRVNAAQAAATQARAAYYPTAFVSGNYSRTDNPTHAFMMSLNQRTLDMNDPALNFNDPEDAENVRLSAGLRYRLYDGGQRRANRNMMNLQIDTQRHSREAIRNTLAYLVTAGYYRSLQARDLVTVHQETLGSMEEHLRIARHRLDAGAAVMTDVLNLEVQVAQAHEDKIRAKHNLDLALASLNTAIGVELVTEQNLRPPERHTIEDPDNPTMDVNDHPDLRAARALLGIREHDIQQARASYAPTLNAFGSMDWDSDVDSDFERSYLMGIMAEWDVFDGFRRRGAVQESRARRDEAQALYEQTRNELTLDLKQATIRVQEAREREAVSRASEESAIAALSVTREQYEQGAATLSDLLTAQTGLTAMRTRRTAALYDYLTARANLLRAQGLLVMDYGKDTAP